MSRIAAAGVCAAFIFCAGLAALALRAAPPAVAAAPGRWLQYQAGPTHNPVFSGDLRANWLTPLGGKINGGLALVSGTLYAVSFDQKLYALDPATGAIRWSQASANILMSTPVVDDGLVIAGSGKDGFLHQNDASSQVWGSPEGDEMAAFTIEGQRAWSVHTVGDDMPSPAIDGSTVVFANGDAHAYGLDLHTGAKRWTTALDGIPTMASATVAGGRMFTSFCHNAPYYCKTIALDTGSGKIVWTADTGGSDCTPTVDNGLVFVESSSIDVPPYHTGGRITVSALDIRTGHKVWFRTYPPAPFTYVASSERQIAATSVDGTLYQSITNLNRVVAFDERTGRERWTAHTSGNVKMSPVIAHGHVYFGDTEGIFYTVDAATGKLLHAGSYLQPFSVSPPIIYGKTMFVADGNMVLAVPLDWLE